MKTAGILLVTILLIGSLVTPIDFSEAQVSNQTVPAAPTNLNATAVSDSQINLSWIAPINSTQSQVSGYRIEVKPLCVGSFIILANTTNTNTVYSDTGLTNSTCYQYKVFAHNIVGTSLPSNNATATTLQTPTLRLPSAPTALNVSTISGTALKLTWNAPDDQGSSPIIGYNIQRNGTVIVNNTGTTQTSYTNTGLLFDHQQTYRVAAWNSVGLGPYSNTTVGKTGTQVSTPKEIENLGQAVSSFVHKYNAIFKQQRDETIKAIKECNEKIKNAPAENRKQIRADCKITLQEIKEKYKDLRNQFKADFKEFRETTKVVLAEAKESKVIDKEDVKEVKQEIKQVKNEVKKSEKEFKKELKEFKKELKKIKKDKNN